VSKSSRAHEKESSWLEIRHAQGREGRRHRAAAQEATEPVGGIGHCWKYIRHRRSRFSTVSRIAHAAILAPLPLAHQLPPASLPPPLSPSLRTRFRVSYHITGASQKAKQGQRTAHAGAFGSEHAGPNSHRERGHSWMLAHVSRELHA
jgi:hypothetical protein